MTADEALQDPILNRVVDGWCGIPPGPRQRMDRVGVSFDALDRCPSLGVDYSTVKRPLLKRCQG